MGLFRKKATSISQEIVMGDSMLERTLHIIEGNTASIVVSENVEAIVLINGKMQSVLKAGKHVIQLEDKGSRLEVCYVNSTAHLTTPWGTPSRIEYIDSLTGVPVTFGASGTIVLGISNPLRLYERCLGTKYVASVQSVVEFLRPLISQEVKDRLASKLISEGASFFDLAVSTKDMSSDIKHELEPVFDSYGVSIEHFVIENLAYDDDVRQLVKSRAVDKFNSSAEQSAECQAAKSTAASQSVAETDN